MENSLTAIEKCLLSKSCDVVNSRDASAKEATMQQELKQPLNLNI
jgi:hypothetical protein